MKKHNTHHSKLRPIACTIASALILFSLEAQAKFADTPLHLQNENSVSEHKVKPQVMFLLDDSGSMQWEVSSWNLPANPNDSRIAIAKRALNAVLDKYKDDFKWGLYTLNREDKNTKEGYVNYQEMKRRVNELQTGGPTPTTSAYYKTAKAVMDHTFYRCQKNYIVLMSDGDANESYQISRDDSKWDKVATYKVIPKFQLPKGKHSPQKQYTLSNYLKSGREFSFYKNFQLDNSYTPNFIDDPYFGYQEGGLAAFRLTKPKLEEEYLAVSESWDEFWDRNTGLQWFSKTLATKDFKKAGDRNPPKENQELYWDGHPDDPEDYSQQTAETFTVGFGSGISNEGQKYLLNGASKPSYFFNAEDAESLVKAFDTIFSNIADANIPIKATGTVAPTVFGSGVPNLAAIVDVNTGSWSSRIKFFDVNSEGKLNTAQTKEPLFSERKTLINLGRPIGTAGGREIYWADNIENGNNGMFNLPETAPANEWREALIPWITRAQDDNALSAHAKTSNFSQPYRIRPTDAASSANTNANDSGNQRNLGDILDTPILTIGDLVDNRQKYLVTAANDGMVHLFQAHSQQHPYSLKLSYIPAGADREAGNTMGRLLKDVAHKDYGKKNQPHHYLINGGLVLRRTAPENNQSHAFLFGAMGQGGRGAYALNIGGYDRGTNRLTGIDSPVNDWINTVPLFETAKGVNNQLGYTVGM
ncbi:MAG: PilC/PilY family type IV pilus protein [Neisseria zoodegmatis]|uniref:PilC/PilY family type IV pilus protein n=1 Tax=Neisseria zoodegmatis TaxID=326523 RepID=UPI0026EB7A01|nr:PilC/PilY family type IV pilus protein [Neisseria zoodegmatis]MDO5069731.1 PilC/PilY family type IV pilus protein [Neisseria zoodegmatis]